MKNRQFQSFLVSKLCENGIISAYIYTPWKTNFYIHPESKKTSGFLTFSRGVKIECNYTIFIKLTDLKLSQTFLIFSILWLFNFVKTESFRRFCVLFWYYCFHGRMTLTEVSNLLDFFS